MHALEAEIRLLKHSRALFHPHSTECYSRLIIVGEGELLARRELIRPGEEQAHSGSDETVIDLYSATSYTSSHDIYFSFTLAATRCMVLPATNRLAAGACQANLKLAGEECHWRGRAFNPGPAAERQCIVPQRTIVGGQHHQPLEYRRKTMKKNTKVSLNISDYSFTGD